MLTTETIQSLVDSGEGYNVEFKVRVPSKVRELTEEICAFANADGGYLLIGVDDSGKIAGAELGNDKRSAIQGSISEMSPTLNCELYPVNVGGKTIWVIEVPSGNNKPYIFSGSIYVREGANSQKLRTAEEIPVVAKDFGHKSMTRNPLIFGLFTRMHLVERVASGIPRMQEAMRNANLPEPEFHTDGIFTVVFKRQNANSANHDIVNGIVNGIVNENEQVVLNLLANTPGLNASEISGRINKSVRTTMRYIRVLQNKDLIEFRGAPKTGGYYLLSK